MYKRQVFGHVGPGGWLSALTLFETTPRHLHSVRARTAGTGCLLQADAFRQLCLDDARFACRVMAHGANLVRHHTDQIDWLTSSSAEERLAEYVLRAGKPQADQPLALPLSCLLYTSSQHPLGDTRPQPRMLALGCRCRIAQQGEELRRQHTFAQYRLHPPLTARQPETCLLYTSRCV